MWAFALALAKTHVYFRVCLDWADFQRICVCVLPLFFFFFFFSRVFETCGYCSCTVQWTVAAKLDFSNFFQPISAHRVLFMDPQISLFSNFFIKNGSHGIIHKFKNYFTTVFFSFQFSAVSKRTLSVHLAKKNLSTYFTI